MDAEPYWSVLFSDLYYWEEPQMREKHLEILRLQSSRHPELLNWDRRIFSSNRTFLHTFAGLFLLCVRLVEKPKASVCGRPADTLSVDVCSFLWMSPKAHRPWTVQWVCFGGVPVVTVCTSGTTTESVVLHALALNSSTWRLVSCSSKRSRRRRRRRRRRCLVPPALRSFMRLASYFPQSKADGRFSNTSRGITAIVLRGYDQLHRRRSTGSRRRRNGGRGRRRGRGRWQRRRKSRRRRTMRRKGSRRRKSRERETGKEGKN